MKKSTIVDIVSSFLILLFTYAALSKLINHEIFQAQFIEFPVLNILPTLFSWLIPIIEIVVILLLFIPKFKIYGLYAALFLLIGFTIFLILMISFDKNLPCSCGGVISKLSWKQHIVFNLFFIILSIIGIKLQRKMNHQQLHLNSLLQ